MIRPLLLSAALVIASTVNVDADDPAMMRFVSNEAYGLGERLEYDVKYKFLTAGTAVFSVGKDPVNVNGRPCFDIRFDMISLKSLDFLYKVRDRYRTLVDIDGIFPWKFEQTIREGGYSKDYSATFDQGAHKAVTTEGTYDVPPFVHDVISAFYYVRSIDIRKFKKGEMINLQNFFDRESHDLVVRIVGRQQVEVDAGTFNCIVVEPVIKSGSLFKFEGKLLLWLSDDDRRIPIKVSTKIPIGTVDAELTGYRGLRGPLSSKVK
ncbi:MAG: DUF3108 domain-containing protein [Candidatus Kapabacteria bacterium]|nr:DUF3108 domain-containing protein [Candidatus Kapabacteria bacterium]